jgi:hypothetical protein
MIKTAVFLVCSGIGYLLGHYLPVGAWSAYVSILVSYHLFLGWLVFTAEHKAGFSLPVFSTILTHSAFLAILIGLAFGRESVPLFGLIRIFIPGLAPFESTWLFSGGRKSKEVPPEPIAIQPDASAADAPVADAQFNVEDYDAWLRYLAQPHRTFRKPGVSVQAEYALWNAALIRERAAASQKKNPD